jgi:hypothetical protein
MISYDDSSPVFWRLNEHRTVKARLDDVWYAGVLVHFVRPKDKAILLVWPRQDSVGPGEALPANLQLRELTQDEYEPEQEDFPGVISQQIA